MSGLPVDLTDPDNNPIYTAIRKNEPMGSWDIQIMVGNFKSEVAAKRAADAVVEFLGGGPNMVQS